MVAMVGMSVVNVGELFMHLVSLCINVGLVVHLNFLPFRSRRYLFSGRMFHFFHSNIPEKSCWVTSLSIVNTNSRLGFHGSPFRFDRID